MPDTLLPTALMLAGRGFAVGPLCRPTTHPSGCSYRGKSHRPCCPDPGKKPIPYAGVKGFTTDVDTIEQYFRWYPTANLGVAMGSRSGHFVIEVDGPKGQSLVQPLALPPTPTVVSRRGPHHWLKIPPGYYVVTTHLDELDIIGDGGQVVGPGSIHRAGHVYHWHEYLALEDIAPVEPPPALMAWLVDRGIFRPKSLAPTQIYPQVQSRSRSRASTSASRAFSQGDGQARLTSGAVNGDVHGSPSPFSDGGGYKTRSTNTRLVTPPLGIGVTELALKPEIQARCLTFFGLDDLAQNVVHLCRVPGHRERRPSAVLRRGDNGHLVYECLHAKAHEIKAYTFPDFYRAQLCGHPILWTQRLTGPSMLPWWERLLIEMGVLTAVDVPHRAIVEDVRPSVHQVYTRFINLVACRWNYEYGQPTTFSVRFALEWCGIGSNTTFLEAFHWLIEHRYIVELPAYTSKRTGKVLALYLPGTEATT